MLSPLLTALAIAAAIRPPSISVPANRSVSRSAWVALAGENATDGAVRLLVDGIELAKRITTEGEAWDAVVPGDAATHLYQVCSSDGCSQTVTIKSEPARRTKSLVDYSQLRIGDIVLDHSAHSEQEGLYHATYTHAALYVGPDTDGTPLIAEAVNADLSEGMGEVRAVPIEQSLAFAGARSVNIFRLPDNPALARRAAAWARETIRRTPEFWSTTEDFAALYQLWTLWNFPADAPYDERKFAGAENRLKQRKWSLSRFNCATLVWRSYYEASAGAVDLSRPNRALSAGNVLGITTSRMLERIKPLLVVPDTLALNGALRQVE